MNRIFLITSLFLSPFVSGQNFSAAIDTSQATVSEIKVVVSVSGPLSELQSLTVDHFNIAGSDTVSVFHGAYGIEEGDPSDFTSFEWNETLGILRFGTGKYESLAQLTRVTLVRRENTTEVITIK